jgi:hypothetical protein
VPRVLANGLDVPLFLHELFSNRIGGFFGWDVIVSARVLIPFILSESRRLRMNKPWCPSWVRCSWGCLSVFRSFYTCASRTFGGRIS